jgi:hypothetical protein
MAEERNHYEVLGVSRTAGVAELKVLLCFQCFVFFSLSGEMFPA